MSSLEDLFDEYLTLCAPDGFRPSTPEAKAQAAEKSALKSAFLKRHAKGLGYTSGKQLQKDLDKMAKKREPKKGKPEKTKAKKPSDNQGSSSTKEPPKEELVDLDEQVRRMLGKPDENLGRGDYYVNPPERLKSHLEATGGKYQLRFPPEPNGWLHIGHAKAISLNFGAAKANGGNCYLRFDDTNPEAEKQEYIDGIMENVAWLGHKPFKVTHTSDYFPRLYELARELIRRGKAYVCFLSDVQVKRQRDALKEYHNAKGRGEDAEFPREAVFDEGREAATVEENLERFEHMKQGRYKEGEASLRMKSDFHSPNPNMWDHMAYRIKYKEHPRTKGEWCIYPTYDFSHCLVDSLENITHSLCTLEFETRQAPNSSYHWLLDALEMYHPKTYETSRCSISCNVMSKRRLHRLVEEGFVAGWDDPRLLTLAGLRRRGYTPTSINTFCRSIGVARSSNEVCVRVEVLESCIRQELDASAPRRHAVVDPLKFRVSHWSGEQACALPNHPAKPDMGERAMALTQSFYVPREKFRLDLVKGYKGMVPGSPKNSTIKLLHGPVLTYESHVCDADGNVEEVIVRMEAEGFPTKGLSVVIWVPENSPSVEARMYGRLFTHCEFEGTEVHAEKAAKEKGVDFVELFNPESVKILKILVEPHLLGEVRGGAAARGDTHAWQFVTVGYFTEDCADSTKENPVFNLIVSLKEDKGKAAIK